MLTNDNSIVQLEAIYQYTIRDVKQYRFNVDEPEFTMRGFEAILRNIQNKSLDEALLEEGQHRARGCPTFRR